MAASSAAATSVAIRIIGASAASTPSAAKPSTGPSWRGGRTTASIEVNRPQNANTNGAAKLGQRSTAPVVVKPSGNTNDSAANTAASVASRCSRINATSPTSAVIACLPA